MIESTESTEWWTYAIKLPSEHGWYAIVKCWDQAEGGFPDAVKWDGKKWEWKSKATILYWFGPFPDEQFAKDWAYEHDPEI